jgi:AraC-like DNA-binding protein
MSTLLDTVRVLHLESTDVCQAACPLCARETEIDFDKNTHNYLTVDLIKDLIKETGLESDFILFHLTSIKGLNYESYITNLRISYAIKLLEEGFLENNSTTKLAENTGFKNVKTFNNTFFAIMNCFSENYKNNGRE